MTGRVTANGKPVGRPPLPDEEKRSRLISVRVTEDEWERLCKVASAKHARDLSKWVRRVMFDAADQWEIGRDPY